jgi:hypothetical protein
MSKTRLTLAERWALEDAECPPFQNVVGRALPRAPGGNESPLARASPFIRGKGGFYAVTLI